MRGAEATSVVFASAQVRDAGLDPGGRARVEVSGRLDAGGARELTTCCRRVLAQAPRGLALDLTELTGATVEGVRAVAECLSTGRELADGVDVAVASSPGRQVLLATLAEV